MLLAAPLWIPVVRRRRVLAASSPAFRLRARVLAWTAFAAAAVGLAGGVLAAVQGAGARAFASFTSFAFFAVVGWVSRSLARAG
jgi:hypothetical protein